VYQQEYCAEFVDWSGEAFFSLDKLTVNGQPVDEPAHCDSVMAMIDTATKTGKERDGTAVLIIGYSQYPQPRVWLLDYDIVQIMGALLENWLPQVFTNLEYWAKRCGARTGSLGAFIEDKNSGSILLQQAARRNMNARPIDSKLTAYGKEERAMNVSGYVWRGWVKFARECFDKTVNYKGDTANHLRRQVVGYRVGNKEQIEDDLLDTFCYGLAITCGNQEGF
jgi:phage terminase large subunit-like protein